MVGEICFFEIQILGADTRSMISECTGEFRTR
jgi:hypothetical protein